MAIRLHLFDSFSEFQDVKERSEDLDFKTGEEEMLIFVAFHVALGGTFDLLQNVDHHVVGQSLCSLNISISLVMLIDLENVLDEFSHGRAMDLHIMDKVGQSLQWDPLELIIVSKLILTLVVGWCTPVVELLDVRGRKKLFLRP